MVDLGRVQKISRVEMVVDNPGYRRGQGRKFTLEIKNADGVWQTIHQGEVFGLIYAKTFPAVRAQMVRLQLDVPDVRRWDLF